MRLFHRSLSAVFAAFILVWLVWHWFFSAECFALASGRIAGTYAYLGCFAVPPALIVVALTALWFLWYFKVFLREERDPPRPPPSLHRERTGRGLARGKTRSDR